MKPVRKPIDIAIIIVAAIIGSWVGWFYGVDIVNWAHGADFSWQNPTDADLDQICIRRSPISGSYQDAIETCVLAPAESMTISPTPPGRNYYVAVAKDKTGNVSVNSNEVVLADTTTTTVTTTSTTTTTMIPRCEVDLEVMTIERNFYKRELISGKVSRNLANDALKTCIAQKLKCDCS